MSNIVFVARSLLLLLALILKFIQPVAVPIYITSIIMISGTLFTFLISLCTFVLQMRIICVIIEPRRHLILDFHIFQFSIRILLTTNLIIRIIS